MFFVFVSFFVVVFASSGHLCSCPYRYCRYGRCPRRFCSRLSFVFLSLFFCHRCFCIFLSLAFFVLIRANAQALLPYMPCTPLPDTFVRYLSVQARSDPCVTTVQLMCTDVVVVVVVPEGSRNTWYHLPCTKKEQVLIPHFFRMRLPPLPQP